MMKPELKQYLSVAEAISKLLYPFAEVVLHDLEKDQIIAIFNPFSQREVSDNSYLDRIDFNSKTIQPSIIGPYNKLNYDGRKLKSISIVIKNSIGNTVGLLCINLDISVFTKYQNILDTFLKTDETMAQQTQVLFRNDLYEKINIFVQNYCLKNNLSIDTLDKTQKKLLVLQLKQQGALEEKNAANYIARTLKVSRATVYNYLKEEIH